MVKWSSHFTILFISVKEKLRPAKEVVADFINPQSISRKVSSVLSVVAKMYIPGLITPCAPLMYIKSNSRLNVRLVHSVEDPLGPLD